MKLQMFFFMKYGCDKYGLIMPHSCFFPQEYGFVPLHQHTILVSSLGLCDNTQCITMLSVSLQNAPLNINKSSSTGIGHSTSFNSTSLQRIIVLTFLTKTRFETRSKHFTSYQFVYIVNHLPLQGMGLCDPQHGPQHPRRLGRPGGRASAGRGADARQVWHLWPVGFWTKGTCFGMGKIRKI